jgi:hypothetical protein
MEQCKHNIYLQRHRRTFWQKLIGKLKKSTSVHDVDICSELNNFFSTCHTFYPDFKANNLDENVMNLRLTLSSYGIFTYGIEKSYI